MEYSAIKNLYGFEDGDTITPGMGVQIAAGYGLHQYYNTTTGNVIQTDFTQHPAVLFPQAYSSKTATIVAPSMTGFQWYYNNISDNAGILDSNGDVKSSFSALFEKTTVTMNGKTFPALRIKGNLVSSVLNDYTDKYIYFVGTWQGKQFTCQQHIPVVSSTGEAYNILLSVIGEDGTGDNVLSSDNDWVQYTAYLQLAGTTINGATYQFQHLVNGNWVNITNTQGVVEINPNVIKMYQAFVEGVEILRVVVTNGGKTYTKTFEVSDIHDPLYIDDGCNIIGDAVKPGQTATFNPKVYRRDNGEEETGFTFTYTLIKRSDGSVITDITVNQLTYDNIVAKGGISVRIAASRS